MADPVTIAVGATAGIGGTLVSQAVRLYLERRRERQAEAERLHELQSEQREDTGQILVERMRTDERTREQLWTWMREARERAEQAEQEIQRLRAQCLDLQREHERCQMRLGKLEKHVERLQQQLAEEYGRRVERPSSEPPAGSHMR